MRHREPSPYRSAARVTLLLACGLGLAAALKAGPARAVTFVEQAQRLERLYAGLLDLRPGLPPGAAEQGLEVTGEVIPVPAIDTRVGSKREPVHPPPAIPRARVRYGAPLAGDPSALALGGTVGMTASPPLTVGGYQATWMGGEVELALHWRLLALAVRGYSLSAQVTGPITAQGAQDRFTLATGGADARLGIAWGPWRPYAGYGGGTLEGTLRVDADGARIREHGPYVYRFAGLAYEQERWRIGLEQQSTESYLRHVILAAAWRF